MKRIVTVAALLIFLPFQSYAASLPQSGSCKVVKGSSPDGIISFTDSVVWIGKVAEVNIGGVKSVGRVTAMRSHNDDGFKFSVFFHSDSDFLNEISIFSLPFLSKFRFGVVSYTEIIGEGRVIHYNTGYLDADCTLLY